MDNPFVMPACLTEPPPSADEDWHREHESLEHLLAAWEAVEAGTLRRWPDLLVIVAENRRVPALDDHPETISADEVMWHVTQHDVRHAVQVVQMMRTLGSDPSSLDLAFLNRR